MSDLQVNEEIVIPASALTWTAARASGPGGQNVNKVSSKVDLRFDLAGTDALPGPVKQRLRALAGSRIDKEGRILITSQATRDQPRNVEDAREKLVALIRRALVVPKPRKKTRPSRGAKQRRLTEKKQQAEKKQARQKPGDW